MKPVMALNVLIERYPLCFFGLEDMRKPIKRGILHDLLATGVLPASDLAQVLRYYCGNAGYLRVSIAGASRIDLEGNVDGEVTAAQAAHARKNLDAILERQMTKAKAKRDAANSAAHKTPDVPAMPPVPIAPVALVESPKASVLAVAPRAPGRRPVLTLRRSA